MLRNIKMLLQKFSYHLKLKIPTRTIVFEYEEKELFDYPPIFIIGCYRSGTSLLRRIMDSHSEIACPPESKFIKYLAQMLQDKEALQGFKSMGFSEDHVIYKTREFISYFFQNYAISKGKKYWVDKTPDYIEYIDIIDKIFAHKARFVFIYRNGLDVALSLCNFNALKAKKFVEKNNFKDKFVGYAVFWKEQVMKMKQSEVSKSDRVYEIRYEDLILDPQKVLKGLFKFLEIKYESEIINYHKFKHDKGIEDGFVTIWKGIKHNNIEKYKRLPKKRLKEALSYINDTLKLLGYKIQI